MGDFIKSETKSDYVQKLLGFDWLKMVLKHVLTKTSTVFLKFEVHEKKKNYGTAGTAGTTAGISGAWVGTTAVTTWTSLNFVFRFDLHEAIILYLSLCFIYSIHSLLHNTIHFLYIEATSVMEPYIKKYTFYMLWPMVNIPLSKYFFLLLSGHEISSVFRHHYKCYNH